VETAGSQSGERPLGEQMPPAFVDAVTLVGSGWQINKLPSAGGGVPAGALN
jgi:hypothetical protein